LSCDSLPIPKSLIQSSCFGPESRCGVRLPEHKRERSERYPSHGDLHLFPFKSIICMKRLDPSVPTVKAARNHRAGHATLKFTSIRGVIISRCRLFLTSLNLAQYSNMASEACRALPAVVTTDYKPKGTNMQLGSLKTCMTSCPGTNMLTS
jgi:hypothetical protein